MRKTFSVFHLALCAVCMLSLFGLRAYGQDKDRHNDQTNDHPNGIVQDWSHRHAVYPRVGPIQSLIALQRDPRALLSWQEASRRDWRRYNNLRNFHRTHSSIQVDWNISLGAGGMAPAMFPAKFTFDTTAAPSCSTDFIVFPVNIVGSSTQPNIVAFNNLYSGTAGANGICNSPQGGLRPANANDDGVSATTIWSYNIKAAGGQVPTSPALSLDGTKVAFVESASSTTAHFHVLAWKNGDGVDVVDGGGLQNVLKPVSITSGFYGLAPAAGSGKVTDLALGSTSDTLSSPFVDYANDVAYVGNDSGTLFRIKNVFCTVNCTVGVTVAPSLDTTWPTGGATPLTGTLTVCSGKLTGPVVGGTGNVYVGCSDGKLYAFTSAGVALATPSVTVGNGSATGGIVDPPMVDVVNGFVYVVSGNDGTNSVVVQVKNDLSSPVKATLAAGGAFPLHSPAFNDNYFSSGVSTNWLLFALAPDNVSGGIHLYGITFNGSRVMTAGAPANDDPFVIGSFEISPATEFLTTSGTAEDRLFESVLGNITGNLASFNLTGPPLFPTGLEHFANEGAGTTGIVVDNVSASAQADSIYFGTLGPTGTNTNINQAVKLTESALQ